MKGIAGNQTRGLQNGSEITVRDRHDLPDPLSGGFFNIELEMTTKH